MEGPDEEGDLKLVKASAGLLLDLEAALPKLLWKRKTSSEGKRVHSQVKQRDLDYVIRLVILFQFVNIANVDGLYRLNHFKANLSFSMRG
jgi:tubulin-specific chaperone D